ncbi:indole-3-glycerol phosphate synthase TrpC [Bernardetia sp.]|uniref:indole-3-glycerol phosphate synthase TrpC n=1 Tax=Bernardetia sp. TaxID=1937974 RepID=UPI0025C6EEB7|nr:indole-3-glycerol phosphate synthase TrpC [Bernardetia sp.]
MLEKIILQKQKEVAAFKKEISIESLKEKPFFDRKTISFKEAIKNGSGIIAEFKRKSPSKGIINDSVDIIEITQGYASAGASALSVLTDTEFFAGQISDLEMARSYNEIPILRKDFMIDEFQIYRAKASGADVILLIAAVLSPKRCLELAKKANELGLEILLEIHDREELAQVKEIAHLVDAVGVNNRNLKTFTVDIEESMRLFDEIQVIKSQTENDFVLISESGLSDVKTVLKLKEKGFQGFLMGEYFMKHQDPARACREFIEKL